jgi:hypothetical protein
MREKRGGICAMAGIMTSTIKQTMNGRFTLRLGKVFNTSVHDESANCWFACHHIEGIEP